jgi:3-deoxy-7-phosphoheptulonate synthase
MKKMNMSEWNKKNWRNFPIKQQPKWPSDGSLSSTVSELEMLPSLVFAGETRTLLSDLAAVGRGESFLLQCGDCAEDFSSCNGPRIHNLLRVILQMSVILAYTGEKPVIKVGRIAGQYAKPRSSDTETINGLSLPSYRGDMVNSPDANLSSRTPNPRRILDGYFRATATLNLIRAFTRGGYASIEKINDWQSHSFAQNPAMEEYKKLVNDINKAINFAKAKGITSDSAALTTDTLYTSHEALLLDYEEAMTRVDTTTRKWYDTSAHMLWIGDRTRKHDEAHVEFLRGTGNPIGIKVGPNWEGEDLLSTIRAINPENQLGRVTIISRMGVDKVDSKLPQLVRLVNSEGLKVVWCCDPMHGNTQTIGERKTRAFADIVSEIRSFWKILQNEGAIPGGVHLEITDDHVTECTGGVSGITEENIGDNYTSNCDPRLNAAQAVELAFEIGVILST